MRRFDFAVASAVVLVAACAPTLPPPEVKAAPAAAQQTVQAHLLLFPEADGEALLGRPCN